jgi:hypothetical protein
MNIAQWESEWEIALRGLVYTTVSGACSWFVSCDSALVLEATYFGVCLLICLRFSVDMGK